MAKKQVFDISTDKATIVDVPNSELPTIDTDQIAANALEDLRRERNLKLAETDYLALGDLTMSDDMKQYRKDLRDITKTYQSMSDSGFTWPTKPSGE
tara:strand:+ start:279 stop:569 length:291 start_codon:yes stop_codon:yes gene_type:complete